MPYVKQERRPDLDPIVEKMAEANLPGEYLWAHLLHTMYHEYKDAKLDAILEPILEAVDKANVKPNGDINYILFKYAKYHIEPSYNNYKTFIGCIHKAMKQVTLPNQIRVYNWEDYIDEYREAAEWIRIKILTPYEEMKEKENGPIL